MIRPPATLALAVLLAAAVAATGCSRSRAASETTSTTSTVPEPVSIALALTSVEPNGTPPPSQDVIAGVEQTLNRYVAAAVVTPLQTGEAGAELEGLFTAAAVARLGSEDRPALVDEGLPRFSKLEPTLATFGLSTIADGDGLVGVVVARVDLQIRASRRGAVVDVVHQGDFALVPGEGGWKIDSYQLHSARDTVPTTTTTARPRSQGEQD